MVDTHATSPEASVPTVAQFPVITDAEQICISFQLRPAPHRFHVRQHREVDGGGGEQSRGELFAKYGNVKFDEASIAALGLKLVSVYVRNKPTQKGPRHVLYFWFAPESDPRDLHDATFHEYAMNAFRYLSANVYAEGESYANENGPACIALKGPVPCVPKTILSLCAGELQTVAVPA